MMRRDKDHLRGCLLGGAVGDALGAPVEFLFMDEIKKQYGEAGVTDLSTGTSGRAEVTDDTQMTLFTAEGILRAAARGNEKGICHPPSVVYHAYLRWLHTQGHPKFEGLGWIYDGWLIRLPELHKVRAPGLTCLSALASGKRGTMTERINDSKGCGGVMRVAPVGLFYPKDLAFSIACECAALTHGHPSGYLSAGALAYIIASIIEGQDIETAVKDTVAHLKKYEGREECVQKLLFALEMSGSDLPDVDAIARIGKGWVGEDGDLDLLRIETQRRFQDGTHRRGQPRRRQRQHGRHHREHPRGIPWTEQDSSGLGRKARAERNQLVETIVHWAPRR